MIQYIFIIAAHFGVEEGGDKTSGWSHDLRKIWSIYDDMANKINEKKNNLKNWNDKKYNNVPVITYTNH